jgi:hypothetical protein
LLRIMAKDWAHNATDDEVTLMDADMFDCDGTYDVYEHVPNSYDEDDFDFGEVLSSRSCEPSRDSSQTTTFHGSSGHGWVGHADGRWEYYDSTARPELDGYSFASGEYDPDDAVSHPSPPPPPSMEMPMARRRHPICARQCGGFAPLPPPPPHAGIKPVCENDFKIYRSSFKDRPRHSPFPHPKPVYSANLTLPTLLEDHSLHVHVAQFHSILPHRRYTTVVFVNGQWVPAPDVPARNGAVHVVNRLIRPWGKGKHGHGHAEEEPWNDETSDDGEWDDWEEWLPQWAAED